LPGVCGISPRAVPALGAFNQTPLGTNIFFRRAK